MRRTRGGFTLVEMMVVVTVSLMLMTMIVPIFKVSTQTVQKVERRLAVYEAARSLLDLIESDIQLAEQNEKGEHWSIKHVGWKDTDTFTPDPGPIVYPGVLDVNNVAYKQSRRVSDALDYVRIEGHGTNSNWVPSLKQFPGGKFFPLQTPVIEMEYPDAWKCSMRSTLLYQHDLEWWSQDYDSDSSQNRWNRPEQLADVGTIELAFIFECVADQWRGNISGQGDQHFDQVPNMLGPGREIKVPHGYAGDVGGEIQRRLGQMKVMDLAVSYWDDVKKQFTDLPENTVVYFWPIPKAVRTTITVCDFDKRSMITLCRITQMPCGSGSGVVNATHQDSAYFTDAPQPGNTYSAVYNRTKYLPTLPNAYNGDASRGWGGDFTTATENTIITQDGVKPINWP